MPEQKSQRELFDELRVEIGALIERKISEANSALRSSESKATAMKAQLAALREQIDELQTDHDHLEIEFEDLCEEEGIDENAGEIDAGNLVDAVNEVLDENGV